MQELASVSLKNPVKIFINTNTDVAPFLKQEFIRIRPNREGDREAIVAGKCDMHIWFSKNYVYVLYTRVTMLKHFALC